MTQPVTKPFMSDKMYDVLKKIALVILPAIAAAYFSLAQIWHLPKAESVVGTITVIDTFLGVLLGISSSNYNKSDTKYDGSLEVDNSHDTKQTILLVPNPESFDNINQKKEVVLKVNQN